MAAGLISIYQLVLLDIGYTFNSLHASSGPSAGADSSLVTLALLVVLPSNTGGGELALELDILDAGLR